MFLKKLVNHSALDSFKSDGITIFGSILHTHIIGKQGLSKIVRDGKEVDYIYNNKYYNGNAQDFNYIKPVKLKRGDQIKLSCVYSSKNKNMFTLVNKCLFYFILGLLYLCEITIIYGSD